MTLLLVLKGESAVSKKIVGRGDCLVASGHLIVSVTVQVYASVKTVHVAVNCSVQVIAVLVHQPHIQVDRSKVWMVFSTHYLEDLDALVHVLEAFGEVLAGVIIQSKI